LDNSPDTSWLARFGAMRRLGTALVIAVLALSINIIASVI
jgi:hypothetical protein